MNGLKRKSLLQKKRNQPDRVCLQGCKIQLNTEKSTRFLYAKNNKKSKFCQKNIIYNRIKI